MLHNSANSSCFRYSFFNHQLIQKLSYTKISYVFDDDGKLLDENYEKRVSRFLDEFEWYIEAFKKQREKGTPY